MIQSKRYNIIRTKARMAAGLRGGELMAVLLAGEEIEDPAIEEDAAIEETADWGELSKEDTADIDSG